MPKRQRPAKLHHYVPQFYLKGFTEGQCKESTIHAWDLASGRHFTTIPRNVAAEKNFLTVDKEGVAPDALEVAMAELEAHMDAALINIKETHDVPGGDDYQWLMNLIGLLATRNPRLRETMRRFEEQVTKRVMSLVLETRERWEKTLADAHKAGYIKDPSATTYEKAKDFHERGEYTVTVSRESMIHLEMRGMDAILNHFGQRHWSILVAQEGAGDFITSDHPVVLSRTPPRRGTGPVGYGTRMTDVTFPVSRRLALVGRFEGPAYIVRAKEATVAWTNTLVLAGAERQIYGAANAFTILRPDGGLLRQTGDLTMPLAMPHLP